VSSGRLPLPLLLLRIRPARSDHELGTHRRCAAWWRMRRLVARCAAGAAVASSGAQLPSSVAQQAPGVPAARGRCLTGALRACACPPVGAEETLKLVGSNVSAIMVTVQASRSKMPTLPSKEDVEKTPGIVGHHCARAGAGAGAGEGAPQGPGSRSTGGGLSSHSHSHSHSHC
jgi:hypothetical protein